jgi:signal transduction histidine kinase
MNKIRTKLIFAFGLLIVVLIVQIFLNQTVSSRASNDFEQLEMSIGPAIRMLDKFQSSTKELRLLLDQQNVKIQDQEKDNRILEIIEVELPYYNSEVNVKLASLEATDSKVLPINTINQITNALINEVSKRELVIRSSGLRNDAVLTAQLLSTSDEELKNLFFRMDNCINLLIREYNNDFLVFQNNLSSSLSSTSRFIGISGVIGLIISLLVIFRTIRCIINPIKELQYSTHQISKGNYDLRVPITGNNELAQLAKSFNSMADELKQNFEEFNKKNKELEQFIYIASHDLQEPLRTISSFTDLLRVQYHDELDVKAIKYLDFMTQSSKRMSSLISGLLDYSRIGKSAEIESINCNDLLAEVVSDMTASIIKYDAEVEVQKLPNIEGYKTEIRLLFQNLISNAIKFRKQHVAPNVIISGKEDVDNFRFEVKDNGIGIPKKNLISVFAIFQRLHGKTKFEGTGIGLAHCKKIIELHGGEIWVESREDVGTSFIFTLPKNNTKVITKRDVEN